MFRGLNNIQLKKKEEREKDAMQAKFIQVTNFIF